MRPDPSDIDYQSDEIRIALLQSWLEFCQSEPGQEIGTSLQIRLPAHIVDGLRVVSGEDA